MDSHPAGSFRMTLKSSSGVLVSLCRIRFSTDLLGFSRIEKEYLRHNQRLWRLGILPILYVSEEYADLSQCKTGRVEVVGAETPCLSPVSHIDPKIGKPSDAQLGNV
jgi:hypothetical protein